MILVTHLLPVEQVAIRLADEGVPLRVIARATHAPSECIRECLYAARDNGTLVDLPREDWPPGFPRDQRALQLSRMMIEDKDAVLRTVQRVFGLTATETNLLVLLLQNQNVPKERLNMVHRTIDVHICRIRARLAPFGITVDTLWGYGYQIAAVSRKRIMRQIVKHVRVPA